MQRRLHDAEVVAAKSSEENINKSVVEDLQAKLEKLQTRLEEERDAHLEEREQLETSSAKTKDGAIQLADTAAKKEALLLGQLEAVETELQQERERNEALCEER